MQKRSQYQKLFKPGTLFYKKKKFRSVLDLPTTVTEGQEPSINKTTGYVDNINNSLCNDINIRMIIGWSQPTIFGVKTWNITLLNGSGHIENVGLAYLESCMIIENVEESEE